MPWNDDGNNNGKSGPKGPWGPNGDDLSKGRRQSQDTKGKKDTPPNPWARRPDSSSSSNDGNVVDDLIDNIQGHIKKMMSGGGSSNGGRNQGGSSKGGRPDSSWKVFTLLAIGFVIIWLGTGFFRVQEGEAGVVLRFGKMDRVALPGLRYHLPQPFESVIVQKVAALNIIDGRMKQEKSSESADSTLILTGDENMVHTNYTVQWKIKEVSEYLFTARSPETTIQAAAESVVREVIGQTTARLALTEGRSQIEARAQEILQKLLDQYKMGIQIVSIQLQNVAPPHQVVDAFNDLQASLVNADQSRNEAEAYKNQIIPDAEGKGVRIKNEAYADGERMVAEAKGEAARFERVRQAFEANPNITQWYYLKTMQFVLSKVTNVIIDEKAGKSILFPLNDLLKKSSQVPAIDQAPVR
jgi:membrane protease subunit HflK